MKMLVWWSILAATFCCVAGAAALPPDLIVAADGSGNFKTVQEAVASIPKDNKQQIIILIKDGVYHEKIRIDASCITLRGKSRSGTRIEFPQFNDDFEKAGQYRPRSRQHQCSAGPTIQRVQRAADGRIAITFSENVTVKETPRLLLQLGATADYLNGSGDASLMFKPVAESDDVKKIELNGEAVIASQTRDGIVDANLTLPR